MLSATREKESATIMDTPVKLIHANPNGVCVVRSSVVEAWNTKHLEVILREWGNPSVRDRLSFLMNELQDELSIVLSRGPNLKFGFRPFAQLIGLPLPATGELVLGTSQKGKISAPTVSKIINGEKTFFAQTTLERMCAIGTAESNYAIQNDDWRWKPWHPEEFIAFLRGEIEFDPIRGNRASTPLYVPVTREVETDDPLTILENSIENLLPSLREQVSRIRATYAQVEKVENMQRELDIARLKNHQLHLANQRLTQENQRLCSTWMESKTKKGEGEIIPLNIRQRHLLMEKFGGLTDEDWENAGVPKQVGLSTAERHAISFDVLVKLCNYIGEDPEAVLEELMKVG